MEGGIHRQGILNWIQNAQSDPESLILMRGRQSTAAITRAGDYYPKAAVQNREFPYFCNRRLRINKCDGREVRDLSLQINI